MSLALTPIHTDRLVLRRPALQDLEFLVQLDNDADVMRFINGGIPVDRDEYERTLLPTFLAEQTHPFGFWMAELDAITAGWISLRSMPQNEAELGYRFSTDFWGLGLATEAARELIGLGFSTNIQTIVATTYEHNTASQRVLEKLGFSLVERFHWTPEDASDTSLAEGMPVWDGDDLRFKVTREEWERQPSNN